MLHSCTPQILAQRHPAITAISAAAGERLISAVGGVVRDAMLDEEPGPDIDIVVEGPVDELARTVAEHLDGELRLHERFATAEIHLTTGEWIDFVSARSETYPHPGALPEVAPGSLTDDLRRRDFSINAIALRLTGPHAGEIVDPCHGLDDLSDGRIRTLHERSFVDDPTRILRMSRYAARLGFTIDPDTLAWARRSAPQIVLSSARVCDELERTASDSSAAGAFILLEALGVGWLRFAGNVSDWFDRLDIAPDDLPGHDLPVWAMRLGLVLDAETLSDDIALDGRTLRVVQQAARGHAVAAAIEGESDLVALDRALRRIPIAAVRGAWAVGSNEVRTWAEAIAGLDVQISGDDLISAGVSEGPAIGEGLTWLREQQLAGSPRNGPAEQLSAVLAYIGHA